MVGKNINEIKAERFKRIASRRTQKILDCLRRLGNCSHKGVYQYSETDVEKIFSAIEQELRRIKGLFKSKSSNNTFSL